MRTSPWSTSSLKRSTSSLKRSTSALERLETDLNSLRKDTRREFNNVNGRLDNGFGTNYEHKVTKNIPSHVRQKLDLRRVRMLRSIRDGLTTELEDFLDNAKNYDLMTKEQFGELLDADLILTGRHADSDINTYVVAEMAIRIRQDDITRAANRAEIFRNATDSPVISAAIGARINPKEAKLADEMNVTTLLIPE